MVCTKRFEIFILKKYYLIYGNFNENAWSIIPLECISSFCTIMEQNIDNNQLYKNQPMSEIVARSRFLFPLVVPLSTAIENMWQKTKLLLSLYLHHNVTILKEQNI